MESSDSLLAEGRELLARERRMLAAGALGDAEALARDKTAFLARLESAWPGLERVAALRKGLTGLIEDARRNERLLHAVRDGFAAARRRIEALEATRAGAVAYARDGSRITSRADACGRTKCA